MSILLGCKEITLFLLIGVGCNANQNCKIISSCEMECHFDGPAYDCSDRGFLELPSFPETTVMIDLGRNALATLPENLFETNVALSSLHIDGNSLTTLPPNLFSSNVVLTYLKLTNNNLTSIPADVFKNNVALAYLFLEDNNLTNVPNGVFRNNVALYLL
ncbi:unnamed protein product [Mytilus edulis]|uniref:LRRNT domain-containing protein n=1 Tax=Mytilus edulis TaxID=6550 RepID=A0A8S3S634_MYTED|nr:unnamed protein product [Mytilus edulis]